MAVGEELHEVRGTLAAIQAQLAGIAATIAELKSRARDETSALFATVREHERRLGAVEKDYTPRREFEAQRDQNREEHAGFAGGQDQERLEAEVRALTIQVTKVVSVIAAVTTALNAAIAWLPRLMHW